MLEDSWIPCTFKTKQYETGGEVTINWNEGRIVAFLPNSYGLYAVVLDSSGFFSSHDLHDIQLRIESD